MNGPADASEGGGLSARARLALLVRASMRAAPLLRDSGSPDWIRAATLLHASHLLGLYAATTLDWPGLWDATFAQLVEVRAAGIGGLDWELLQRAAEVLAAVLAVADVPEPAWRDPLGESALQAVASPLSLAPAGVAFGWDYVRRELAANEALLRAIDAALEEDRHWLTAASGLAVAQGFFSRPLLRDTTSPAPEALTDRQATRQQPRYTDRLAAWHDVLHGAFDEALIDPSDGRFDWRKLEGWISTWDQRVAAGTAAGTVAAETTGGAKGVGEPAERRRRRARTETVVLEDIQKPQGAAPPRPAPRQGAPRGSLLRNLARRLASPMREFTMTIPKRTGTLTVGAPASGAGVPKPSDVRVPAPSKSLGERSSPGAAGTEPQRAERVVSTGFARRGRPGEPLDPARSLVAGGRYVFWLEVGPLVAGSIEATSAALPVEELPVGAVLDVVLFGFPGGLRLVPGAEGGRLFLGDGGAVWVKQQPGCPATVGGGPRLFFPVRAPWRLGVARLRCNIYYEQVLVQSRLVEARVSAWPRRRAGALVSRLEYSLSRTLSPARLRGIGPHRLSVMLNDDGSGGGGGAGSAGGGGATGGTHQLRFVGAGGFTAEATLGEAALGTVIDEARRTLRRVAWGGEGDWREGQPFRYAQPSDVPQLSADLVALARTGWRLYRALLPQLARGGEAPGGRRGPREARQELEALLAAPGVIQVAARNDVRQYLPAALVYDHPFDTNLPSEVCPTFLAALAGGLPLEDTPCWAGRCPVHGDLRRVCPSGFWGFRHELSFPLSSAGDAGLPLTLGIPPAPRFAMGLSTALASGAQHEQLLHGLRPYGSWQRAASRDAALAALRDHALNVVYFYCHGGRSGSLPYIQVGPRDEVGITADNLGAYDILWDEPGPLVFINGCRTTDLQPSSAFDLVTALIADSGAAGVIGTEITVFEPLACAFAEAFFRGFLVDGLELGAAVRRARLGLLAARNPLGLVYVPFALASLALSARASAAAA